MLAACGIFVFAFVTMIVTAAGNMRASGASVILDTCGWLVALTATAIVNLLMRSR
jgi:hypothetical protein